MYKKKWFLLCFFFCVAATSVVFFLRATNVINTRKHFPRESIGTDIDSYLAKSESRIPNIRKDLEKKVIWIEGKKNTKTKTSIVYIHGFSASSAELRPLIDEIGNNIQANIFFTRLKGHGRDGVSLGTATTNDWIYDYEEALAIGQLIGDHVIVIGNSTGSSLITWYAAQQKNTDKIAAYILFSPNYGIQSFGSFLVHLPYREKIITLLLGNEYTSTRPNPLYKENWTTSYPSKALFPMVETAKLAQKAPVENIKTPTLFVFSPQDKVVRPQITLSLAQRWGAKHDMFLMSQSDDPFMHILSGNSISPSTIPFLRAMIVPWILNNVKHVKEE